MNVHRENGSAYVLFKDLVESDTFYLSSTMLEITFPLEQKTKADGTLASSKN